VVASEDKPIDCSIAFTGQRPESIANRRQRDARPVGDRDNGNPAQGKTKVRRPVSCSLSSAKPGINSLSRAGLLDSV